MSFGWVQHCKYVKLVFGFVHTNHGAQMIGHGDIIEGEGLRRFLLNRTQYRIGGFGKCPGYPPGTGLLVLR